MILQQSTPWRVFKKIALHISALVSASLIVCTDYQFSEDKHIGSRYTGCTDNQYTSNAQPQIQSAYYTRKCCACVHCMYVGRSTIGANVLPAKILPLSLNLQVQFNL